MLTLDNALGIIMMNALKNLLTLIPTYINTFLICINYYSFMSNHKFATIVHYHSNLGSIRFLLLLFLIKEVTYSHKDCIYLIYEILLK